MTLNQKSLVSDPKSIPLPVSTGKDISIAKFPEKKHFATEQNDLNSEFLTEADVKLFQKKTNYDHLLDRLFLDDAHPNRKKNSKSKKIKDFRIELDEINSDLLTEDNVELFQKKINYDYLANGLLISDVH